MQAHLTSRRASRFGVTATLGAGERYDDSHAFALRALEDGFDGVRYLLRHDPPSGSTGSRCSQQPGAAGRVISDALLRDAASPPATPASPLARHST